jgi:hypothetical protein
VKASWAGARGSSGCTRAASVVVKTAGEAIKKSIYFSVEARGAFMN